MMHLDEKTGLLYIDEVPFTLDHLKQIKKLFKYGKKTCSGQFKHSVHVCDTSENPFKSVWIDEDLINDIFKLNDLKLIAKDKQFTM